MGAEATVCACAVTATPSRDARASPQPIDRVMPLATRRRARRPRNRPRVAVGGAIAVMLADRRRRRAGARQRLVPGRRRRAAGGSCRTTWGRRASPCSGRGRRRRSRWASTSTTPDRCTSTSPRRSCGPSDGPSGSAPAPRSASVSINAAAASGCDGRRTSARRLADRTLDDAARAALGWSMGSELLIDIWQPHALLLPVLPWSC